MKYAFIILISMVLLVAEGCAGGDAEQGRTEANSAEKPESQPESSVQKDTIREMFPEEAEALANARKWVKEAEKLIGDVVREDEVTLIIHLAQLQAKVGDKVAAIANFKRLEEYAAKRTKPQGYIGCWQSNDELLCGLSRAEASVGFHERAIAIAMKFSESERDRLLQKIASDEAMAGFYDNAADATKAMRSGKDSMYTKIIHEAVAVGDYDVAKRLAAYTTRKVSTFVFIAVQEANSGDEKAALLTFRRAMSDASSCNAYDFLKIAQGQIEAGLPDDARKTLAKITEDYSNDFRLLTRIADVKVDLGDRAAAATMLEKAKLLLAKEITRETVYRLSAVAVVEARAVGKTAALKTFKQAEEFAIKNKYPDVMGSIITAMARAGFYAEAKAEVAKLSSSQVSITMRGIARMECERGLYEQAKKTAESIASGHRTYIYQEIMFAQAREGKFDEARKTLELVTQTNNFSSEINLLYGEIAAGETKHVESMITKLLAKNEHWPLLQACQLLARTGQDARLEALYKQHKDIRICTYAASGYLGKIQDLKRATKAAGNSGR